MPTISFVMHRNRARSRRVGRSYQVGANTVWLATMAGMLRRLGSLGERLGLMSSPNDGGSSSADGRNSSRSKSGHADSTSLAGSSSSWRSSSSSDRSMPPPAPTPAMGKTGGGPPPQTPSMITPSSAGGSVAPYGSSGFSASSFSSLSSSSSSSSSVAFGATGQKKAHYTYGRPRGSTDSIGSARSVGSTSSMPGLLPPTPSRSARHGGSSARASRGSGKARASVPAAREDHVDARQSYDEDRKGELVWVKSTFDEGGSGGQAVDVWWPAVAYHTWKVRSTTPRVVVTPTNALAPFPLHLPCSPTHFRHAPQQANPKTLYGVGRDRWPNKNFRKASAPCVELGPRSEMICFFLGTDHVAKEVMRDQYHRRTAPLPTAPH